jgi:antitoxin CptB
MDDIDARRRRALWRATHRGTKEMDWLLGRYVAAGLATMSEEELAEVERAIGLPDPELQSWLMGGAVPSDAFAGLVARIRAFHGLGTTTEPVEA